MTAHPRRAAGDGGFVLVSSLIKALVALALVGTAGYDTISMLSTHIQVQDHAQEAAALGHETLVRKASSKAAYAAIVKYAEEHGETVVPGSFKVGRDRSVTIGLTRTSRTIAAEHIPGAKQYVVATSVSTAHDPLM